MFFRILEGRKQKHVASALSLQGAYDALPDLKPGLYTIQFFADSESIELQRHTFSQTPLFSVPTLNREDEEEAEE